MTDGPSGPDRHRAPACLYDHDMSDRIDAPELTPLAGLARHPDFRKKTGQFVFPCAKIDRHGTTVNCW